MPRPLTTDTTDPVQQLLRRTPVASPLSSSQWSQLNLALRDRALFSSKVESLRFLANAKSSVIELAEGNGNLAEKRARLKQLLDDIGYSPALGEEGTLKDLSSDSRIELILDTNLEQAQGYASFVQGQDETILDRWPCQELIRVIQAEKPRDWSKRWADAGGLFYNNRKIARKDDPIWETISRFGTPYPPFDFNSGMDLRDITREEAIALGIITADDEVQPTLPAFNAKLEASVPDASPEILEAFKDIFGDQVDVTRDGKITWQGNRITSLYEKALNDPTEQWTIKLGTTTDDVVQKASALGADLDKAQLLLDADHIRHINRRHGEDEKDTSQRPVTVSDLELIPHVWREPDSIKKGETKGDLIFEKEINGNFVTTTWSPTKKGVRIHSLFVKKGGKP